MAPTSKQLNFIKEICSELDLPNPKCKTIQEASNWISNHIDSYNSAMALHRYDHWEAEDYYEAGMQVYDEYEG